MDVVALWEKGPVLQVSVYVVLSFLGAGGIKYLWRKLLPLLTARTRTTLDERLAAHTAMPVAAGVLLFCLWRTAVYAEQVGVVTDDSLKKGLLGLEVATIYAVAFALNGVAQATLEWYGKEVAPRTQTQLDDDFLPLARRLFFILLMFIATAMALHEMGKDITALVATASVASLAVALAAQETLANMIAGLMIMVDRPFRIGDRIEFRDGKIGDVLEIGMRSTRILSLDNHVLVVPNKDLASERIINYKVMDPRIRLIQPFGVAYQSDIATVKQLVMDMVRECPQVLAAPTPQVLLVEFGDSSMNFELRCWVDHYDHFWSVKDALNTAIKVAFDRHGISIPFPQREVRMIGLPNEAAFPGAREAAAGKE